MEDLLEELETIQTIYCLDGEVDIQQKGSESVVLSIHGRQGTSLKVVLTLSISPLVYPSVPPSLSIKSSNLTRAKCDHIKIMLEKNLEDMIGEPMLFSIISRFYDLLDDNLKETPPILSSEKEANAITTCLLQLDHMRNKHHYVKKILSWADGLKLVGRLFFCHKVILILLQGSKKSVKEYIRLNRTQTVDVDCKGRPCKERLLSVLFEDLTDCKNFVDFSSCEVESLDSLKANLKENGLGQLSEEMLTLIKR